MTDARARADESVATRFSRVMNATISPLGVVTDPPIIAVITAVLLIAFLGALRMDMGSVVLILGAVAAVPVTLAFATSLALLGGRKKVVDWLASLPFPLENMNAVLNGLGESLEVSFAGERPSSAELNAALERIHPDAFCDAARAGGEHRGHPHRRRRLEAKPGRLEPRPATRGSSAS